MLTLDFFEFRGIHNQRATFALDLDSLFFLLLFIQNNDQKADISILIFSFSK